MKLYLIGPMTGYPNFNRPAFDQAACVLRARGHEVYNPAALDDDELVRECETAEERWRAYLARDLPIILTGNLDCLVALPGWKGSRGACLEVFTGGSMGLPVHEFAVPLPPALL